MDNSQYINISTLNRHYPLLLFILGLHSATGSTLCNMGLPSAIVYTYWSTLCYCLYILVNPLLLFIHTGLASATGSTLCYCLYITGLQSAIVYTYWSTLCYCLYILVKPLLLGLPSAIVYTYWSSLCYWVYYCWLYTMYQRTYAYQQCTF